MPRKYLPYLLSLLLLLSLSLNLYLIYQKVENYRVMRVVDGDSLDLKDGRRIRLLAIDAPEKGRCLHDEARDRLKELVLGKRVKLENLVMDDYGRILANVFEEKMFINKVMLSEGLTRFTYATSPYYGKLKEAAIKAKEEKLGTYSDLCRNISPPNDCVIKGNIRHGVKTYHLPHCYNYDQTIIDEAFGDRWFCTEEETQTAGFEKAKGCTDGLPQ